MSGFLNWKTAVASIVLGLGMSTALFLWTGKSFTLSGLDLFFAVTTVISLAFNLWQLFRDQYKYTPLKNSLIGLFNDIKGREVRAHQRQLLVTSSPAGSAMSPEAVRLEFYDLCEESKFSLTQLREHVVAAIHTLDPAAASQQLPNASDFGLTEQEKVLKEERMQRLIEKARIADAASTVSTQISSQPPTSQGQQ